MSSVSVRFDSVRPRDIELLVLEELAVSSTFRSWLCEALALETESASLIRTRDSRDGETGDFDQPGVECGLEVDGERLLVAVTAVLEADDPRSRPGDRREGSRTRRERALGEDWDDVRTVLLAPAALIERRDADGTPPVDATVGLESIRDRFAARGTDRGDFHTALIEAAIDGGRREDDALVREYRSAVAERNPDIELSLERPPPDAVGDTGTTVELEAASLAPNHRLVHEVDAGTVDLSIPGAAPHLQAFAARYVSVIPTSTSFLESGETLVLRQSVPAVDSGGADVDAAVDAALESIQDLLAVSERVQERTA
ncbi:hypothetical protein [Natronorubrum halophilum]|uniref:hypothetical protein n=1 Tax=Natronorubrum halophilum TaxID=1702106 RepID=UPI0010C1AC02|nr:hypothetical protein [Natronorubrum halophilum]